MLLPPPLKKEESALNPPYLLARLPMGIEIVVPRRSLRPRGSAMVVSGVTIVVLLLPRTTANSMAFTRLKSRGLIFISGRYRWVPLAPTYAASTTVFRAISYERERFQFCTYGICVFSETANPGIARLPR